MSFGFNCLDDSWDNERGQVVRTLRSVALGEVSIVANPAYEAAHVDIRSCPFDLKNPIAQPSPANNFGHNPLLAVILAKRRMQF